jgi:eukaryotic-like serine/threonine-protein kinase
MAPSGGKPASAPAFVARPGEVFGGRFQLRALLGRGGSGEVWSALDAVDGHAVALKLFMPGEGAAGEQPLARFHDEVRIHRRLQHPDIQPMRDSGLAQGRHWIALAWFDGHDLARYATAARRLPPPVVARLGARIAGALAHAHGLGLWHRDLKPANVLVHLPRDEVRIIDFGIARHDDDPHRTRSGGWVGTPAYMAPELLAGAPAGAATDQYALGVMLFELLASRRPFDAPNLGELLRQVATAPVPDLCALRPDVAPALAGAVMRAIARDPSARWPDANSLAQTLHGLGARPGSDGGGSEAQSTATAPASPPSNPPTR